MKPSPTAKIFTYVFLILICGSFLFPLIWMISTALKPIDQTMAMPPTFIPKEIRWQKDAETAVPVRTGKQWTEPALLVQQGEETPVTVRASLVQDGFLTQVDYAGVSRKIPVTIHGTIDATPEAPWIMIRPEADAQAAWLPVAESALIHRTAPRWRNFIDAVKALKEFPRYLFNTLLLCILNVVGTVISSSFAAYGFSRINWKGRDKVFLIALATMMIPFPVLMVPLYSLFKTFGWIGTLKPLWVTAFFANAFHVFLLRQFFMGIPRDLAEAARIDGCSEFRIFWQIILPLCKPAITVVALFQFMFTWNDFLGPLIFLTDQRDFTLALGLQFFQSKHGGTQWHYLMAASTIVAAPVIVLFFFAQRTFIEGISMTGVKG